MAGRIAVIGSCMIDLVTYVTRMPEAGETLVAPSFEMGFGGKGANQAVACARLGSEVMMLAKVGDDDFGANTLRNFAAEGIDCRFVERVSGVSSGVAPIFVEPDGQNRILIVTGANDRLLPADIDRAAAARTLLAAGLASVIVTLGGEGALWVSGDETRLIPPLAVTAVDTTGAGDAFIGGFAHHYVETGDIDAALIAASRYAAQSITARGTQRSFPSAAAFAAFCAQIPASPPA